MSNVIRMDGTPHIHWRDLLTKLLDRDDIAHVVVVVQLENECSEISYDTQKIYELMMAQKQLSAHTDEIVGQIYES